MRVVVTGASGFVGRAVVEHLSGAGHRVRALVRETLAARTFRAGVDVLACGDLARFERWPQALEGAGALVDLAAIAHRSFRDEQRMREVNFAVARNAAQAAAAAGARFVFLSTVKVLGEETSARPFGADDPCAPPDAYARAKADAEIALATVAGLDYAILRPPLVYGPGVKANFLALMRAVDRGWPLPFASVANRRSLVYVGNLADVILSCLDAPGAAGKTYLVGDGDPVSTPELVRAIARALKRPARLLPFPPALLGWAGPFRSLTRSLEIDDSAIRRELGWRPPFTFEHGLRATAEWYLAQGR